MDLVGPVRDRVRTLLKIRRPRHTAPAGDKPAVGARLFRDDVRMSVQAGMTDSLWRWLVAEGWREVTFRPDRRRYRDIQSAYVTRLIDASSDERERILSAAIANAAYRPRPMRFGARDHSRS
ncbi:MAG: hypothetical protein ACREBN_08375 [Burkholderiaceae bacterium]